MKKPCCYIQIIGYPVYAATCCYCGVGLESLKVSKRYTLDMLPDRGNISFSLSQLKGR